MCGFVGVLGALENIDNHLKSMADAIAHRGPDDDGFWKDTDTGIALAHRRLAIVDLSPAGHQPMMCSSGRYVIAFNGEIYNHVELRNKLKTSGHVLNWRGHSDTETLLAGFDTWGVRSTIEQSIGMFAIAVWDRQERKLLLIRDRLGEKPVYYGWQSNGHSACFLFGSELKALKKHPAFNAEIDRNALSLLMRHNYVPTPHSIYKGIYKLEPGSILSISLAERDPVVIPYWSLVDKAKTGHDAPYQGTVSQAIDDLEKLLMSAVKQQMAADVPLGAFLSGGIDSSTVVALMQAQSDRPVKTFTIGFNEEGYNEAVHAKAVAKHLGTEHTELYITPKEALDVVPMLPSMYCEPFSDSSQVPTYLVSKLAKKHVTVSLSGDAGDELFSGYTRYTLTKNLWNKIAWMPSGLRDISAGLIRSASPDAWNKFGHTARSIIPANLKLSNFGDKIHKGADVIGAKSINDLYLGLVSHWRNEGVVLGAQDLPTFLKGNSPDLGKLDDIQKMMALDAITYLPDDILVKVDRAAMSVSLEGRVPFLDHRVVEFAWRLPMSLKQRDGVGKWALRQVLYRHVPKELIERPKMGFGVPIEQWLRGPLKEWAEDLLSESRLKSDGYFDHKLVRQKWSEHLSGARNWQYHLWDVLMFQAWLESNRP
ncbi:asparagine synthase (glutamine-hydrolyzing) [Chromobacterium violaceum]|uniref:asparagine synthase (glutamine-hydrolyzing) n=1 Tax=Chromobacterium violaceum TaxID=536 RepID=UPI001B32019D|nr:asparagine synthase (glutamine-hydrolyzing) [Chromobacterium violaceum]MBP4046236.1 asparagine synthase (glutamine-hydrolyzing) [Chromobacterium violaceum]